MRYSSLIRKLIEATAYAELHGEDVADILKNRCFDDTGIVRMTLINTFCDPRLKLFADFAGGWKRVAKTQIEQFAEKLDSTDNLTMETATMLMDDFLNEWLKTSTLECIHQVKISAPGNEPESTSKQISIEGILDDFAQMCEVDIHGLPERSQNPDIKMQGARDYQEEKMLLNRLPNSLIKLAQRIGRTGDGSKNKNHRFVRAGKSDIVGLTIGNDLMSLMPSEVALLAEPKTQDIFINNYVAQKLQLFASASSISNGNKRNNGPVIIVIDNSGSMEGGPIAVARVLAAAVAIIAWRNRRKVVLVAYSNDYDYVDLGTDRTKLKKLLSFYSNLRCGGNNENGMFQWFFNAVLPEIDNDYTFADMLCISDCGWSMLTDETKKIIKKQKERGMLFYGLNVDQYGASNNDSPMNICDSKWKFIHGECIEVNIYK